MRFPPRPRRIRAYRASWQPGRCSVPPGHSSSWRSGQHATGSRPLSGREWRRSRRAPGSESARPRPAGPPPSSAPLARGRPRRPPDETGQATHLSARRIAPPDAGAAASVVAADPRLAIIGSCSAWPLRRGGTDAHRPVPGQGLPALQAPGPSLFPARAGPSGSRPRPERALPRWRARLGAPSGRECDSGRASEIDGLGD